MVESTERLGKDNLGIVRLNRDARSRQSPFHSLQTSEKKSGAIVGIVVTKHCWESHSTPWSLSGATGGVAGE